jgi:hypothetical protein
MQLSEKQFMEGFDALVAEAYDMPPLIYDDIADKIRLVKAEIQLWKAGKADKPSWGFFQRLFEDILDRAGEGSPWDASIVSNRAGKL